MANVSGQKVPGSGRRKGTPNKSTQERLERERVAEQIAAAAGHPGVGTAVAKAMEQNRRLAKEELEEVVPILKGIVAQQQRAAMGIGTDGAPALGKDTSEFKYWIELYINTLAKLAPYQSPTFRAVVVAPGMGTGAPPMPDGSVIEITDAVAAARVYRRIVSAGAKR